MSSVSNITSFSGMRAIDTSKMKVQLISELPESEYQQELEALKSVLEASYAKPADTSNNPTYKEYATVKVNGKTVAEIDNHGWVKTSNALGASLQSLLEEKSTLSGPQLAQMRAEKIAQQLGGTVVKSSTAITQSQFNNTVQARSSVNVEAMKNDPLYQQLQNMQQMRTAFLTQLLAQGQSLPS